MDERDLAMRDEGIDSPSKNDEVASEQSGKPQRSVMDHAALSRELELAQRRAIQAQDEVRRAQAEILSSVARQAQYTTLRRLRVYRRLVSLVILAGLGYLIWLLLRESPTVTKIVQDHGLYLAVTALLGISVGTSELVSRYRDEPMRALTSLPALIYLMLNATISLCAYGMLTRYGSALIPSLATDPLLRSIAAGFGAMAILRSKFFTLRTEKGEDISVGPDAAVSAFLSAADRGVDRARAARRLSLVFDRVSLVTDYGNVKDFIRVSLLAFQNLTDTEERDINAKIKEIYEEKSSAYPSEELKLQALCYAILVIVGEYNFNQLIDNLVRFIEEIADKEKERKKRAELADKFRKTIQEIQEKMPDTPNVPDTPKVPELQEKR